eukprot:TRINITY_DN3675_c0_g1_i3.p1 TRINITY_DN3675_c0_g1~~TRINITY_DN3675_c0_g1_i3.p1  ORF type:complete len:385 (+),score=65.90 TRINITY_DN3675_c0_g1_i3:303-1457(+)
MQKLDQIVKQMDMRFKELNSEMNQLKETNTLLKTKLIELNSGMIEMKKTNTQLETRLNELNSEMISMKKTDTLLGNISKDTNTKLAKLETRLSELNSEMSAMKKTDTLLGNISKDTNAKLAKLENDVNNLKDSEIKMKEQDKKRIEEKEKKKRIKAKEDKMKVIKELHNDKVTCDVEFNGVQMHEYIISVRCPTLIEKIKSKKEELNNISFETLELLKTYLYMDVVQSSNQGPSKLETLFELWRLSKNLKMERLEMLIRIELRERVKNKDSAVKFAVLSIESGLKEEMRPAILMIRSDASSFANELALYPNLLFSIMVANVEAIEEEISVPASTFNTDCEIILQSYSDLSTMGTKSEKAITRKLEELELRISKLQEKLDTIFIQ